MGLFVEERVHWLAPRQQTWVWPTISSLKAPKNFIKPTYSPTADSKQDDVVIGMAEATLNQAFEAGGLGRYCEFSWKSMWFRLACLAGR